MNYRAVFSLLLGGVAVLSANSSLLVNWTDFSANGNWVAGANRFMPATDWVAFETLNVSTSVSVDGDSYSLSSWDDGESDKIEVVLFQEFGVGSEGSPTTTQLFSAGDVIVFKGEASATRTGSDPAGTITRAFIKLFDSNDLGSGVQMKSNQSQLHDIGSAMDPFELRLTFPDLGGDDSSQILRIGFEITTVWDGASMGSGTVTFSDLEVRHQSLAGPVPSLIDHLGGVELRNNWSWTPLLGFIYTGGLPYVYSFTNDEWLWLNGNVADDADGGAWFWRFGSLHWGWTSAQSGDQYYDHRWDHMRPFMIDGAIRGLAVAAVEHDSIRAIAVHDSGEKLIVFDEIGSEPGEFRRGALFETQEGMQVFIYAPVGGLPDRIQIENYIYLFSNYTETTVDIAEVKPDGDVTIRRAVEMDPSALAELRALSIGSVFAPMSSGGAETTQFVNWDAVKRDLAWAGVGVGAFFCGKATIVSGPFAPATGLACAGALISVVGHLKDTDDVALDASSVAVGAISCGTGSYAECIPLLIDGGVIGITAGQAIFGDRKEEVADVRKLLEEVHESENMVLVAGGTLATSNALDGTQVDTFYIGRYEVTWGEWKAVRTWAAANGYDIGSRGRGCADEHPVHSVSWYDVLKWSNAKSEMEGRTPVYSHNGSVFKTGEPNHTTISQNLSANGYRLPLEAEWEFAARGGNQTNGYTYAGSNDLNAVGWYSNNASGGACNLSEGLGTWPVGQKAANELGLYDMSGNVFEWCWDRWSDTSSFRVFRGGSWSRYAAFCAVSLRGGINPTNRNSNGGFRLAVSAGQ